MALSDDDHQELVRVRRRLESLVHSRLQCSLSITLDAEYEWLTYRERELLTLERR